MKKIFALLLCLVLTVALLASCGQRKRAGSASSDEEETTKTEKKNDDTEEETNGKKETAPKNVSAAGEWKMDLSEMTDAELIDVFSKGVSSSGQGVDISLLSKNFDLRKAAQKLMEVYQIRFLNDGTYVVKMKLTEFSDAYLSIMQDVFGAMTKLSLEDYAKITGMNGEALGQVKEYLSKTGMNWESFLTQTVQATFQQMKQKLSDPEALKEAIGISDDTGATIEGDTMTIPGEWTQEGNRVELHTKSGSVTVLTLDSDGNKMELTSLGDDHSFFEEGITLERVD